MSDGLIYISIESDDLLINKLKGQIEKYCHLEMWVMKATSLLHKYLGTLDDLDKETDKVEMGKIIELGEISYMSSITTFLRCFINQQSLHLQINNVTTDKKLRDCYAGLMALRNDEYVHWKGMHSDLNVTYSMKPINEKTIELAKTINISFNQKFGPGDDTDLVKKLFEETINHIKLKRDSTLEKLRSHLAKPEVFEKSKLLNENGDSIIKKN